jgi:hypothetical protein
MDKFITTVADYLPITIAESVLRTLYASIE